MREDVSKEKVNRKKEDFLADASAKHHPNSSQQVEDKCRILVLKQNSPVNPGSQLQTKSSTTSVQCPPFSQGFAWQSLMFTSQLSPVHPGWQTHSWKNSLSTQTPFLHGVELQRSIFSWHRFPVNPVGQLQLKSLTKSVQFDPRRHGLSAQSSTFISQVCPSQPGKHSHVNRPCSKATQVAPLLHGLPLAEHGSI